MKKNLVIAMLLIPVLAFAAKATFQCYFACGQTFVVSADLSEEEILQLIAEAEANCPDEGEIVITP